MMGIEMPRTAEFVRLVEIRHDFDRLITNLRDMRRRAASARSYLANTSRNTALARTYLDRALTQHRATIDRLRDFRREAHEILASYGQSEVNQHAA
jgi:hypothetical protein